MEFVLNGKSLQELDGYVFCDNDFLSVLAQDVTLLLQALELFPDKLCLDPFTQMEFLRSVFLPEQREVKEKLIDKAFSLAENHQEILLKIMKSAMDLSRLYAYKSQGTGASLVDLLLAGRMATVAYTMYLATGNSKDFPSCIFDTISIINFEQNDGSIRAISIKKFNKEKYQKINNDYEKMLKRYS